MSAPRVNLLPEALVRRLEHRRQARRWVPVWLAVAGLMIAGQFGMAHRSRQATASLDDLRTRAEPLRAMERRIDILHADSQQARDILSRQAVLEQADVPLALLQIMIAAREALSSDLQLDSYRMEETVVLAATSGPRRNPAGKRIIVTGSAESDVTVSAFVDNLRQSGVFVAVTLEASQSASAEDDARRTFQLRCEMSSETIPKEPAEEPLA